MRTVQWRNMTLMVGIALALGGAGVALLHRSMEQRLLLTALFSMILLGGMAFTLSRWVGRPLARVRSSLRSGDTGELDPLSVDATEFGDIARLLFDHEAQKRALRAEVVCRAAAENEARVNADVVAAVAEAAQRFMGTDDWESTLNSVLAKLGRASGACCTHVCRLAPSQGSVPRMALTNEWAAATDSEAAQSTARAPTDFAPLAGPGSSQGGAAGCPWDPVGDPIRVAWEALLGRRVGSVAAVPIVVSGALWGALAFAECDRERIWSDADLDALRAAAGILGESLRNLANEEALRRSAEELEQRVQLRTQQLQAANNEMESFSYSVSHDLRAPIRAISGYARLLAEESGDDLNDEGRRYLSLIHRAAGDMGCLIDDLLNLSRLGRRAIDIGTVDSTAVVQGVVQNLYAQEAHRDVRCTIGDLPQCRGDEHLLRQVWVNLLANAWKFTRQREQAEVSVSGEEIAGECRFTVADNGTGFDMRYADKLFGVFQRLHRAEDFEGTGVGLAIVHNIVRKHGGRVSVDARPGEGARFSFAIPAR